MRYVATLALATLALASASARAAPIAIDLGTAANFAVLGGSTVTNTGLSVIGGDLGVSPGTAITGFPAGIITGTQHAGDAVAAQAERDLTVAYNAAAGQACGTTLTGQDLGGLTLMPGVYCFTSSAALTGTLTLDAKGDPNAHFLFQIGSTLTTSVNSAVNIIGRGLGGNVFYQVGSSATLGGGTAFAGNILALTSIGLGTGASIACGRALAGNGAVTLDTNIVSTGGPTCEAATPVPEPAGALPFAAMLATGLGFAGLARKIRD